MATNREKCQQFALKHKVIFEDKGEVGFGRPCVGFIRGNGYLYYNPVKECTDWKLPSEYIWTFDPRLSPPENTVPHAYHKVDCMCVLVPDENYEAGVDELANWIDYYESVGEVEVKDYPTGATGTQALFSGIIAFGIKFK